MENTLSIYVESVNETWEMADDLALKLTEYKKDHPEEAEDADAFHLAWFSSLSEDDKAKIDKHTPLE